MDVFHRSNYFFSGTFQQVGEFVVDGAGKHKLLLNSDTIVWPNNNTVPSSDVQKCRSCDVNCYNGKMGGRGDWGRGDGGRGFQDCQTFLTWQGG